MSNFCGFSALVELASKLNFFCYHLDADRSNCEGQLAGWVPRSFLLVPWEN